MTEPPGDFGSSPVQGEPTSTPTPPASTPPLGGWQPPSAGPPAFTGYPQPPQPPAPPESGKQPKWVIAAIAVLFLLVGIGGTAAVVVATGDDEATATDDSDEDDSSDEDSADEEIVNPILPDELTDLGDLDEILSDELSDMDDLLSDDFGEILSDGELFPEELFGETTESSQEAPVPVGEAGQTSGISFTVVSYDSDATDTVLAESPQHAQPPAEGRVYVQVTLSVQGLGGPLGMGGDTSDFDYAGVVGSSGTYEAIIGPETPTNPNNVSGDDDDVTVVVTFEVHAADVTGLVLKIEPSLMGMFFGSPLYLAVA